MMKTNADFRSLGMAIGIVVLACVCLSIPETKAQTPSGASPKPQSWPTFDFSEAEFLQRFNKLAKDFNMRPIAKISASTNKVATTTIYKGLDDAQRIVVTTPVGHRNVKVVKIHRERNQQFEPAARFILSMLLLIAATDPTASPNERDAILRDLGVVRTKTEAHLPADKGEVTRGRITYYFVVVEDTMQFMVSVDR